MEGTINAKITITARTEGDGLLLSLSTDGDYSSEMIDRRFYSIDQVPPNDLSSPDFWSPLLITIGKFLGQDS